MYYFYMLVSFFFSSRRRHTRCALVTGVQTCALPIYLLDNPQLLPEMAEAWQTKQSAERLAGISQDVLSPFDGAVLGNPAGSKEIGRASCRERVGQYV